MADALTFAEFERLSIERQQKADGVAESPSTGRPLWYYALGLAGEAGEIADETKKAALDHESAHVSASVANVVMHELGDVLWYVMIMAQKVGCTLEDVARANIRARDERAARADAAKSGSLPARS